MSTQQNALPPAAGGRGTPGTDVSESACRGRQQVEAGRCVKLLREDESTLADCVEHSVEYISYQQCVILWRS